MEAFSQILLFLQDSARLDYLLFSVLPSLVLPISTLDVWCLFRLRFLFTMQLQYVQLIKDIKAAMILTLDIA